MEHAWDAGAGGLRPPTRIPRPILCALAIAALAKFAPVAAGSAPTPSPEPRYLIFWRSPDQAPDLIRRIGTRGDSRTRLLGLGVPTMAVEHESLVPGQIRAAFDAARRNNIAVMLHFDFHVAWQNRPDLWNWFDPAKPGYNPANRANVEWYGWDGPPARVRYLNWGQAQRMPPPVCFTSKRVRAEWARIIRSVIAPTLRSELAALRREGRGALFAGILVGSEPTFDSTEHTDPDSARLIAADGAPRGRLGYRALLDRGYTRARPPAAIVPALAGILQETVAFWCREFVQIGIPRERLYPHVPSGADVEMTCSPPWTAFNPWSRPGWSTYAVGRFRSGFKPLTDELRRRGSPPWAGVEANAGIPGSSVDWETYLGWHYNHGAVLVGINTGATGTELPARLERSAYSADALAAYRRFLADQPLRERPARSSDTEKRLRSKMQAFQDAARAAVAAHRDPTPIIRELEAALPSLLQAERFDEAMQLIDAARARMKTGPPTAP